MKPGSDEAKVAAIYRTFLDEAAAEKLDAKPIQPFTPTYSRHRFRVSSGDRMLLFTDGVLETPSPDDTPFDSCRIEALLSDRETGSCEDLARRLLAALHGHADSDELAHDDVTFLLAEFVQGPPGPALWHVFKHRLLRQERR